MYTHASYYGHGHWPHFQTNIVHRLRDELAYVSQNFPAPVKSSVAILQGIS